MPVPQSWARGKDIMFVRQGALICFLLFLVLIAPAAFAQRATASISGAVTDPTAAIVPGALVSASETSTGRNFTGTTNSDGFYLLTNLAPGNYTLRVEKPGFEASVREKI